MKISKIIFTSYFSVFGLLLLSILVLGFINKDKSVYGNTIDSISETIDLNNFKHIKLQENCKVILQNNNLKNLTYTVEENNLSLKPTYTINNDTLIITPAEGDSKNQYITIETNDLLSITGDSCYVTLNNFNTHTLSLNLYNSSIKLSKKTSIENININIENSELKGWDYSTENMILYMNNSTFKGNPKETLKSIQGNITNHSLFIVQPAFHYDLNIDESCNVRRY